MTDEELKRLEAMIAAVKSEGDDQPWSDLYEHAWDALPAALAEIRRLGDRNAELAIDERKTFDALKDARDEINRKDAELFALRKVPGDWAESMRSDNTRLRGLVKDAEWTGEPGYGDATWCPWCSRGAAPEYKHEHTVDCPAFTPTGDVR